MKDPYKVLGVDKSADPETIKAKYQELHDLYGEQRFLSGKEGNEGARKLQELEEAWALISSDLARDTVSATAGSGSLAAVDELIRQGKYDDAQNMLDSIADRNGEWHYMQAIIFYKREWLTDSKTQLEMALRDDPNNQKYRASLEKLQLSMGGGQAQNARPTQNQNQNPNGGQYNPPPYGSYGDYGDYHQPQQDMSNCLSTCCCAYCLTDCLCNMMRCC